MHVSAYSPETSTSASEGTGHVVQMCVLAALPPCNFAIIRDLRAEQRASAVLVYIPLSTRRVPTVVGGAAAACVLEFIRATH